MTKKPIFPGNFGLFGISKSRRTRVSAKFFRTAGVVLGALGILVTLFVPYQLWFTGIEQHRSQNQALTDIQRFLPESVSSQAGNRLPSGPPRTALTTATPAIGSLLGILSIPKLNLTQAVIQGVEESQLSHGPGHYPTSAELGAPGNVAIAGHRTTWGEPFRHLDLLVKGDPIIVTNGSGRFMYRVTHKNVVSPNDVSIIGPSRLNLLTLTTCNPPYSAATRLEIQAQLVHSDLVNNFSATRRFITQMSRRAVAAGPPHSESETIFWLDLTALLAVVIIADRARPRWRTMGWRAGLLGFVAIALVTQLFHYAMWVLPPGL